MPTTKNKNYISAIKWVLAFICFLWYLFIFISDPCGITRGNIDVPAEFIMDITSNVSLGKIFNLIINIYTLLPIAIYSLFILKNNQNTFVRYSSYLAWLSIFFAFNLFSYITFFNERLPWGISRSLSSTFGILFSIGVIICIFIAIKKNEKNESIRASSLFINCIAVLFNQLIFGIPAIVFFVLANKFLRDPKSLVKSVQIWGVISIIISLIVLTVFVFYEFVWIFFLNKYLEIQFCPNPRLNPTAK